MMKNYFFGTTDFSAGEGKEDSAIQRERYIQRYGYPNLEWEDMEIRRLRGSLYSDLARKDQEIKRLKAVIQSAWELLGSVLNHPQQTPYIQPNISQPQAKFVVTSVKANTSPVSAIPSSQSKLGSQDSQQMVLNVVKEDVKPKREKTRKADQPTSSFSTSAKTLKRSTQLIGVGIGPIKDSMAGQASKSSKSQNVGVVNVRNDSASTGGASVLAKQTEKVPTSVSQPIISDGISNGELQPTQMSSLGYHFPKRKPDASDILRLKATPLSLLWDADSVAPSQDSSQSPSKD